MQVNTMQGPHTITDREGHPVKEGRFSVPELRMAAKAGFRVFENGAEVTQTLICLFDGVSPPGGGTPPPSGFY